MISNQGQEVRLISQSLRLMLITFNEISQKLNLIIIALFYIEQKKNLGHVFASSLTESNAKRANLT